MPGDDNADDPAGQGVADDQDVLGAFLRRRPLAYAAYRINYLLDYNRDISESDEIPFVTSMIFPVVLLGYIALARIQTVATSRITDRPSVPTVGDDGHVFVMSSQSGYRTQPFLEVAAALRERGERVCLLCSPGAESKQDEWETEGYTTVSHRTLHGHISLWRVARRAVSAAVALHRLRQTDGVEMPLGRVPLCYNFLFLETVKRETVRELVAGDPRIHSFSPMPYLLDATTGDSLFVYQHGLQPPLGEKIMAVPFFTPAHYLTWGAPWRETFRQYSHPDSDVSVVGSPWYDHLATERTDNREPDFDVLFVSGTHGLTDDAIEAQFEELTRETIAVCERHDLSLAIKLHPLEDIGWFEERGWAGYVTEFEDIDDALLSSRVSVTNASTAFVESAVLGVPAVVADLWEYDLDSLAPMAYVTFTNGPSVGDAIERALFENGAATGAPQPIRLGGATDRICATVTDGEQQDTSPATQSSNT
jgi:hypothetical protein